MEGKQGYLKGMDMDSAFTKRDPNSYFRADNFRVVTDGGSSSGSLENEKGTILSFKIPDITNFSLPNTPPIPDQLGLKIIGATTMVDDIILFTTNSSDVIPNSYGQIWRCKFDEATGSIIGLTGSNELDVNTHLVYNAILNFSTEYRIGRAIALYETTDKQRIYWTDNYNPVRTFNLADPDSLTVPVSTIDLFPGASLSQPVIKSIITGNILSGTQIQFTYRLLNTNGGVTAYAPPTPMTPLPNEDVVANSFSTFQGGGSSANKGVVYDLTGLDTNYEVIEHIAIHYNPDGTLANIWKFAEDSVPSTGNITVSCTTLTNATAIAIEEYSIINSGFDRCKDIEVQGNRLIAANISTDKTEFNFDARAYRFNNPVTKYSPETPVFPLAVTPIAPIALLQDSNNNLEDVVLIGGGSTPLWNSVPLEHDAINIFNREQENNWFDPAQQYKYQSDGTTLGGEGPNVKYEFTTIDMVGNEAFAASTDAPNHITVPSNQSNALPLYKGTLQIDGSPQPIHINNQIANLAAPWAHANYNGYARGEIYRFGLVFYDKKGVPSFVEWVGDIKFPDVSDGFPLQRFENGQAILQQLGIKFSVDISSIASKISGYSIVRLDREDKNKTKLGTGFHMYFNNQDSSAENSLMHRYYITGLGLGSSPFSDDPFPVTNKYNYYGDDDGNFLHLSDRPGENNLVRNQDVYNRIGYLVSPFGSIYTSQHTANDYIETLEYYNAELRNYYEAASGTGSFGTDSDFGFSFKMKEAAYPIHGTERIQVQKSKDMYSGEVILKGTNFMEDLDTTLGENGADCSNSSYCRAKALLVSGSRELVPLGIGFPRRLLRLHTPSTNIGATDLTPTIPHMSYSTPKYQNALTGGNTGADIYWYGPDYPGNSTTINFGGGKVSQDDVTFKSVGYRRYLDQQYGGNTFESRSTNQYLYIGHFQTTVNSLAYNLTTEVFNGDTYVNYYDEEMIERYVNAIQNPLEIFKPHGTNKLSVAVCGPVESAVNTNWRSGRNWAKDREVTDMGAYAQNSTIILSGWNQEDRVQNQFFAEDFLAQFVKEHPAQLWASNIKINGELFDNWREFPIANKTEVDGIYGPINRITSFKDNLMFYQDKAFGVASLDERSVIQDGSGQELVLGTGGVFPTYRYVSTTTGTVHQFSVVPSEGSIYHYDARLKKFFKFSGGLEPISDLKGLSSFFAKEVIGEVTATDKTVRDAHPMGVHGTYDPRYNRVLYTFLNSKKGQSITEFISDGGDYFFPAGSFVMQGTDTYLAIQDVTVNATSPPTSPNLSITRGFIKQDPSFTLSYNEFLQAFESFYDFRPQLYLEYGRRLLSVSPYATNEMHEHNKGAYGQYYNEIESTSKLHTIFSQPGDVNKVWNNVSYMSELYDTNNVDVYNETMDRMQFKNNYQNTGVINLVGGQNIKRRMRTWRTAVPRELDKELSRMRNPWLECILDYDNTSGYRHILHDIIYSFTPAKM